MTAAVVLLVAVAVVLGVVVERLRASWERTRLNRRSNENAARRVALMEAPAPRLRVSMHRDGDAA